MFSKFTVPWNKENMISQALINPELDYLSFPKVSSGKLSFETSCTPLNN